MPEHPAPSTSLALWMPQLVKSFGLTHFNTGLVNAVPFWHRRGVDDPVGAATTSDRTRRACVAQRPCR